MDHIINVGRKLEQEIWMAKAKIAQPPREVMQIVTYLTGSDTPIVVRYASRDKAEKQYSKLLEHADHGKPCMLMSECMTVAFRFPQNIAVAYLVDIENNNFLLADSQKRINAMMQTP